jgi:hypothetical protein
VKNDIESIITAVGLRFHNLSSASLDDITAILEFIEARQSPDFFNQKITPHSAFIITASKWISLKVVFEQVLQDCLKDDPGLVLPTLLIMCQIESELNELRSVKSKFPNLPIHSMDPKAEEDFILTLFCMEARDIDLSQTVGELIIAHPELILYSFEGDKKSEPKRN